MQVDIIWGNEVNSLGQLSTVEMGSLVGGFGCGMECLSQIGVVVDSVEQFLLLDDSQDLHIDKVTAWWTGF